MNLTAPADLDFIHAAQIVTVVVATVITAVWSTLAIFWLRHGLAAARLQLRVHVIAMIAGYGLQHQLGASPESPSSLILSIAVVVLASLAFIALGGAVAMFLILAVQLSAPPPILNAAHGWVSRTTDRLLSGDSTRP